MARVFSSITILKKAILLVLMLVPTVAYLQTAPKSFNILDFGAIPDDKTDNTKQIQSAIDAAATSGGQVYIPAGRWLVAGSLRVKSGVNLVGTNLGPMSPYQLTGSVILATGGRGNENAEPLFEMWNASVATGFTVFYPEQSVDNIVPYPWTFYQRNPPVVHSLEEKRPEDFNVTISDITLINSYNGIRTGPEENGRHIIRNVHGCVLRRGILVDWVGDIGRIENVQFHSHFWFHPSTNGNWDKVFSYMQKNLEAFTFGRSDWEFVTNTFVFPAKIGYKFIRTENGNCNGQFLGIAADATESCIVAESIQSQGLLITNGQFNSHKVGNSTQVIIEKDCEGSIRFNNCGFWGPVVQNVHIKGNSYVSFFNCYFSSNHVSKDKNNPNWSIIAENGKLQVQGCTFDGTQTDEIKQWTYAGEKRRPESIWLRNGVKHAIISGNNGWNGISIRNDIDASAIIKDNEQEKK